MLTTPNGQPTSCPHEMLAIAAVFYQHLLYNRPAVSPPLQGKRVDRAPFLSPAQLSARTAPFAHEEILTVIRQLPRGKCPGPDGLASELYQAQPETFLPHIHGLIEKVFFQHSPPSGFTDALTTLIHKKGRKDDIRNYRPISPLTSRQHGLQNLGKTPSQSLVQSITHSHLGRPNWLCSRPQHFTHSV